MKGSLVHAIIASLDDKDRQRFLSTMTSGKGLGFIVDLFSILADQETYSESDLLRQIGQTKRQKNHCLELLGQRLITFLGDGNPEVIVFQVLATAPRLIENRQDRQATELIEWAIALAEQSENYHALQSLWRLAELFPDQRPAFNGMSYGHALACGSNLVAYRQLEQKLRQTPTIEDQEMRLLTIADIEASPLLESPGQALGYEARLLYWRIKAICKYLVRNHREALFPQTNLVATLEERLHENLDVNRRWIKEASSLAVLHAMLGNLDAAKQLWDQIERFPTNQYILECEKMKQIYPAKISAGIDFGDSSFADTCCKEVQALMRSRGELFSPGLQCHTLYYCASYYLADLRLEDAARILSKLRSFSRPNTPTIIYSMTKILEIILEIERWELEDAARLIKNLKMSKHEQSLAGIAIGIHILSQVTTHLGLPRATFHGLADNAAVKKRMSEMEGQPILAFFDINAWVEAKSKGCRMMEIFQHQTSLRSK